MSPYVPILISEGVKILVQHLQSVGKFETLTEEEARAYALRIGDKLSETLPSPEDLEAES